MKDPVLILGGRSDIGLAIAHAFAAESHPIMLAARNAQGLELQGKDLSLRHRVEVSLHEFDALALDSHEAFVTGLEPRPGVVVCAIGLLGDQQEDERDLAAAVRVMRTNFEGPASVLGHVANRFAAEGEGVIVGISSVAGDRGRGSNYIYGSAKAGFTAYLAGLRNRLAGEGVHVLTVKPGFVATAMTEGLDLPAPLTAAPGEVSAAVLRAVAKKRNVIYTRPVWRLIMGVIRAIPEPIFKKLSL
ncbi:SDR family oxidoreductase [Oceanicola sp. S124]|uniref:SDR family oxidoreductase n=1 Tax=Oceanicola sp. S124 TaxID=1042378 RepID=UPI0002557A9B|nr:SDR family oxidoreductase [Oceanicola sp. S124]